MPSSASERIVRALAVLMLAGLAAYVVLVNFGRPTVSPTVEETQRPTSRAVKKETPRPTSATPAPAPKVEGSGAVLKLPDSATEPITDTPFPSQVAPRWPVSLASATREELETIPLLSKADAQKLYRATTQSGGLPYTQVQLLLGFSDAQMRELQNYLGP